MNAQHKKVKKVPQQRYTLRFYKELFLAVLAVASVSLLLYEWTLKPSHTVRDAILWFDVAVAVIFLADYCWMFAHAPRKWRFMVHNWYLLLASIPIVDSWAEILRGLRLLELLRLIRAGEHVAYVMQIRRNGR